MASTGEEGLWVGVELSLVLLWNPKWLRKILRWLWLESPREIGMIPPVKIVFVGEWIVGWLRETLSYLHLFLNKF